MKEDMYLDQVACQNLSNSPKTICLKNQEKTLLDRILWGFQEHE
jgi:hypothetical protein